MVSARKPKIPLPPHPRKRREPVPSSLPMDDRDAEARVKAILESPNYRIASEDPDFLASDAARGLRLQMDYLKPELALRAQRVERTIVVFGSARISRTSRGAPPGRPLRAAAAREPGNADTARRLAVAERVVDNSRYYDMACEFGRIFGEANRKLRTARR